MARRPVLSSQVTPLPQHVWGLVKNVVPPMHEAGRPFVAGALTFGLFGWRHAWSRSASLVAAGALALCFREPKRVAPTLAGAVVAPVDGVVVEIDEAVPPTDLGLDDAPRPRIGIKASPLDPYVHRAPVAGHVSAVGSDGSAFLLKTPGDVAIGLVSAAANLAGRVASDVQVGEDVALGQTYALVRFGSRVDLYLPPGTTIQPLVGQRTVGGETVLAVLS